MEYLTPRRGEKSYRVPPCVYAASSGMVVWFSFRTTFSVKPSAHAGLGGMVWVRWYACTTVPVYRPVPLNIASAWHHRCAVFYLPQ